LQGCLVLRIVFHNFKNKEILRVKVMDFENSGWGFGHEGGDEHVARKGPPRAVLPDPPKYKEPSVLAYAVSDAWKIVKKSFVGLFAAKATNPVGFLASSNLDLQTYQRPVIKDAPKPVERN